MKRHRVHNLFLSLLLFILFPSCDNGEELGDTGTEELQDEESLECRSNADCSDGAVCNGLEQCVEGQCRPGEQPQCDDGKRCTQDYCSEEYGGCVNEPVDMDGDGYISSECGGVDCDDDDALIYPDAPERCNTKDDDCDGFLGDEDDLDGDGYANVECGGPDCDDTRPGVHPGALEICDAADNNCDGFLLSGEDDDGDLYADVACGGDDCDDDDPDVHPGATERCNGIDDDCNGAFGVEEDQDKDGYAAELCGGLDCDDSNPEIYPGAAELCNAVDDNCDGLIPEDRDEDGFPSVACGGNDCNDGDSSIHPDTEELCNSIDDNCDGIIPEDADGDGFASSDCGGDDCDDEDPGIYPGAPEGCDGIDNDCDGFPGVEEDADNDGFLHPTCGGDDCDDSDREVHPGAEERCNGIDDDCDEDIDEGMPCLPGESVSCTAACGTIGIGFCTESCMPPSGEDCSPPEEVCNGIDDDCANGPDDLFPCVQGQETSCTTVCGSMGRGVCSSTCTIPEPGACDVPDETCNGADDDCDGLKDEGICCRHGDVLTVMSGLQRAVSMDIVWSGSEYGLIFECSQTEPRESTYRFARVDRDGNIFISPYEHEYFYALGNADCAVAWSGSEYGISMVDWPGIYFVTLAPDGAQKITEVEATLHDAGSTSIAWSGSMYGVSFKSEGYTPTISMLILEPDGTIFQDNPEMPIQLYEGDLSNTHDTTIEWVGNGYDVYVYWRCTDEFTCMYEFPYEGIGIVRLNAAGESWLPPPPEPRIWSLTDPQARGSRSLSSAFKEETSTIGVVYEDRRTGNSEIFFTLAGPHAAKLTVDRQATESSEWKTSPDIAASPAGWGIAWTSIGMGDEDVYFTLASDEGEKIRNDLRVTESAGPANSPSVAWDGSDFGLVWVEEIGGLKDVRFVRVRCDALPPDPQDNDEDGHVSVETGGDDCDDEDPDVNPGEEDVCNGIDDDCSGAADDLFDCSSGKEVSCSTTCGSTGTGTCHGDCTLPSPVECTPPDEVCNGEDDDCNALNDDGICCPVDSSPVIVSGFDRINYPQTLWTGSNFAVFFSARPSGDWQYYYYVVRLDSSGNPVSPVSQVGLQYCNPFLRLCRQAVVWTGSEFGFSYSAGNIRFVRLDAVGNPLISEVEVLSGEVWDSSITWSGSQYGVTIAERTGGRLFYSLLDTDGTITYQESVWDEFSSIPDHLIEWVGDGFDIYYTKASTGETCHAIRGFNTGDPPEAIYCLNDEGITGAMRPDSSWNADIGIIGVVYEDRRTGAGQIFYTPAGPHAQKLSADVQVTTGDEWKAEPSIKAVGNDWGVAWVTDHRGNEEVYYNQVDSAGAALYGELRVTEADGASQSPSVDWTGSQAGIAWVDDRSGSDEIYFVRIECK